MKYNEKELVEMSPEKWDGKSRNMLVWCDNTTPMTRIVCGYDPIHLVWLVAETQSVWSHCAEIPEESNQAQSTDEKIEVMKAYTEGKTIQCKKINGNDWYICNPAWDWTNFEYRVMPEPAATGNIEGLKRSLKYAYNALDIRNKQIENLEKENEDLKSKIKSLRVERDEMANAVSSAVWKELMDRAENIDGPVNTRMVGFGFNDISDIVLNKILEYKPEKKVRRMTYKELDDWLEQGKGVIRIAHSVRNTISYDCEDRNHEVSSYYKICAWDETEWHEPLIEE